MSAFRRQQRQYLRLRSEFWRKVWEFQWFIFGIKLCVGGIMMALPDGTSTPEVAATRAAAGWVKAEELFRHQHV
jgi:hypothetical protein